MEHIETDLKDVDELEHEVGRAVEVLVNFKPVLLHRRRITGLGIKESAIRQGINIQRDFVLFEDRGGGRRELIRDNQIVHVRSGARFEAVPGDDNS